MLRAALLSVAVVFAFACPVLADNVILNGSFTVSDFGPYRYTFSFSGSNFATTAAARAFGGSVAPATACSPCEPGATINLGTQTNLLRPSDFLGGSLSLNGMTYGFHNLEGSPPPLPLVQPFASFTFATGNVSVPMTGDAMLTINAPFTMTGSIHWSEAGGTIFSVPFSGSGTASLVLTRFGENMYIFQSITYGFTQQTPEPAAIMLLGSGLLGYVLRQRRNPL